MSVPAVLLLTEPPLNVKVLFVPSFWMYRPPVSVLAVLASIATFVKVTVVAVEPSFCT